MVVLNGSKDQGFTFPSFPLLLRTYCTLSMYLSTAGLAASMPDHTLMFGLDANTYEHGSSSKLDVVEIEFGSLKGTDPDIGVSEPAFLVLSGV